MSTGEHDPTRLYHEKRDALKEEQSIALAALRVKQAEEQAQLEVEFNIRWRELQQSVGFRK